MDGSHPVWEGVAEFKWGERPDASDESVEPPLANEIAVSSAAQEGIFAAAAEVESLVRSTEESRAAASHSAASHLRWPPDISHDLRLRNSADSIPFSEYYTNYTRGFKDVLDYIFIDRDALRVHRVLPFPTLEEMSAEIALPSSNRPSDHVAVVVDIEFNN